MSKENVKLFYEALSKDAALQEKSKAIAKKHEGQKLEQAQLDRIYQQELIPLAKGAGYDFTLDELKEYAREIGKIGPREVSEEELAAVAGGADYCACAFYGQGYGGSCQCAIGGYGDGSGGTCVCVIGGGG